MPENGRLCNRRTTLSTKHHNTRRALEETTSKHFRKPLRPQVRLRVCRAAVRKAAHPKNFFGALTPRVRKRSFTETLLTRV